MKTAICVGLNYKGTSSELGGCENDAKNMKKLLTSQGFNTEILFSVSVKDLVERLNFIKSVHTKDDTFVLTYSGHGTKLFSSKESDSYDEALVLHKNGYEYLVDDDLRSLLESISGNVFYVLDSCYSGGMERFTNPYFKGKLGKRKFTISNKLTSELPRFKADKNLQNRLYGIFASDEKEVSWDLGDRGLFTDQFLKELKVNNRISTVIKNVREGCQGRQTPRWFTNSGNGYKKLF